MFFVVVGFYQGPSLHLWAQENTDQGVNMFNGKNYYGAERYFQDILRQNPESGEANYYLGRIANHGGSFDKASEYFEKAVVSEPSNADYHAWNGINYTQLLTTVDFMRQAIYAPKALHNLERAVELDPSHIEARIWLAGYYANAPSFAGGSREKARDQYEKIFAIDPDNIPALLNQGIMQVSFEEYDKAMVSFERIIDLDQDFYPVYLQIGRLSCESGKFHAQGELSLRKYIDQAGTEYRDTKDEAWWYLGEIYVQQEKAVEARKAFEMAVSLDPENEEYRKSLKNIL